MTILATSDDTISSGLDSRTLREQVGLDRDTLRLGLLVGRNHLLRGDHAQAFSTYSSLVLMDPTDVEFQVALANCAFIVGNALLSLEVASAAIGCAPQDPRGYLLSGRALLALKEKDRALADLDRAHALAVAARDADLAAEAKRLRAVLAFDAQADSAH